MPQIKGKRKKPPPEPPKAWPGMKCGKCGQRKLDVCERPDGYARDVNDEEGAMYVACDACDRERLDDI